jgi:hypothetical protein
MQYKGVLCPLLALNFSGGAFLHWDFVSEIELHDFKIHGTIFVSEVNIFFCLQFYLFSFLSANVISLRNLLRATFE